MANKDKLETELEDLKKQIWHLSKDFDGQIGGLNQQMKNLTENVIPDLKEQIENSSGGGGSSGGDWIVVYDKTSDDPALNWNLKNGITITGKVIEESPDFTPYHKIRFTIGMFTYQITVVKEYVIKGTDFAPVEIVFTSEMANQLFLFCISFDEVNGQRKFRTYNARRYTLGSNKLTYTIIHEDPTFHFAKIEVQA